jgi:hypothetical protein
MDAVANDNGWEDSIIITNRSETDSVNVPLAPWPSAIKDEDVPAGEVANNLLASFCKSLKNSDENVAEKHFAENGYWRDHLALSWAFRTLKGTSNIAAFIKEHGYNLTNLTVESTAYIKEPTVVPLDFSGKVKGIVAILAVTTKLGCGRGVARIVQDAGKWKFWTLYTNLAELRGFEEPLDGRRSKGTEHGNDIDKDNWLDERENEANFTNNEPTVLIIGASIPACPPQLNRLPNSLQGLAKPASPSPPASRCSASRRSSSTPMTASATTGDTGTGNSHSMTPSGTITSHTSASHRTGPSSRPKTSLPTSSSPTPS